MTNVVGIVLRKDNNIHYLDYQDNELAIGDKIVCRFEDVVEIGEVVSVHPKQAEDIVLSTTKKIVRKATYYDLTVEELNKKKESEGYKKFEEIVKRHDLPMKLIDVHMLFDKSKMVFYFTSDKRVDFREMVKELATYFKIRIELRQIGVRDEAKIVGGLGPCGMNLCCRSFLTDFESISIKMAKDQNLPLNPLKISGICGRLMCCLKYEYDSYKDFVDLAPEKGTPVKCSYGKGIICGYEPLKNKVIVEFENETKVSLPLDQIEIDKEAASALKAENMDEDNLNGYTPEFDDFIE